MTRGRNDNAANDDEPIVRRLFVATVESIDRANTDYDHFLANLTWQPIADYDLSGQETVLLKRADDLFLNREQIEVGYYGADEVWSTDFLDDDSPDFCFRKAQDNCEGQPLGFEPVEFARINDLEWLARLIVD